MDKGKQIVTDKSNAGASGSSNRKMRALIDRSKLRILLCDTNASSCKEVASLLRECSYQVISVGSTGEAIHVLSSEGPTIDIVLAELDLPMANCLKMLKYITEDQELQRIPVIMLVTQDKISMLANCLRYGAVDYLLTPLGINELLNLSTHVESKARGCFDFQGRTSSIATRKFEVAAGQAGIIPLPRRRICLRQPILLPEDASPA